MSKDIMDTLKGILGDNAEEKIQSVLSELQNSSETESGSEAEETAMVSGGEGDISEQIKNLVGQMSYENDRRSNLLLSLKPYMRSERQKSIDSAIKILNLTKLSGLFK